MLYTFTNAKEGTNGLIKDYLNRNVIVIFENLLA